MDQKSHLKETYCSFLLSNGEFALSVQYVQEVVNPPEKYSKIPLSPNYLLGLFNLRGTIIPVVDLRILLNLSENSNDTEKKIAILELNGHCIGLLFDKTGEVFRSSEDEKSNFSDVDQKTVVEGVFKKNSGKRMIQILNIQALFNLDHLPKAGDQVHRSRSNLNRRGSRRQCISFVVGQSNCALLITEIQEILKFEGFTHATLTIKSCLGAIDLRGATVPVIDFATFLNYQPDPSLNKNINDNYRIIIIKIGDDLLGLLVESVENIITFYDEDLKTFPVLGIEKANLFQGCLSIQGHVETLLLNYQNIFSDKEITEITRGHSEIFKSKQIEHQKQKQDLSVRQTFITFRIASTYAISIKDVKEIIEVPSQLLKPPGLPKYCKGVLNLRGKMVLIANGRTLYGEPESNNHETEKVLIFNLNDHYFGIVVDEVEAIHTFNDREKLSLPEALYRNDNPIQKDLIEAALYKDSQGNETSLLILNASSIAHRIKSMDIRSI